jgi:hypothetical protein
VAERVTAILKARDVSATIAWYTRIGFELRGRHSETETPTWCELARDGVVLQFLAGDTPWPGPPTFTGTIYLYPASVSQVYQEIREDVTPAWGPEVRAWGSRELGLQDPDGYFLTFTEPAEPGS